MDNLENIYKKGSSFNRSPDKKKQTNQILPEASGYNFGETYDPLSSIAVGRILMEMNLANLKRYNFRAYIWKQIHTSHKGRMPSLKK